MAVSAPTLSFSASLRRRHVCARVRVATGVLAGISIAWFAMALPATSSAGTSADAGTGTGARTGAGIGVEPTPIVRVSTGLLAGVTRRGVDRFLGIPYAAPPIGPDRWRSPQPPASWSGTRSADHFGASCWQAVTPQGFGPWTHEYVVQGPVSEDCLFLNVWTPARRGARLPVLFWIHGGGFTQGSGSVPIYDGSALASRGIVVVTVNYRLGALGFLAYPALTREAHGAPPGNYGLQDLIAALRWLHRNVQAFGGDPAAITLAGQSAGAVAVHDLIASPLASGLFARAIAESGLPNVAPTLPLAQAERAGEAFARSRGVTSLEALRALTPAQLMAGPARSAPPFAPIEDGVLLPKSPETAGIASPLNDTPILIGMNADEDSAFSTAFGTASQTALQTLLRQTYGALAPLFAKLYPASTDAGRARAVRQILRDRGLASLYSWARRRLSQSRRPAYGYLYEHIEPGPQSARYRVFHSSEIPYIFGTLGAAPERGFTDRDRRVAREMSNRWVSFIETGDPNAPGLPRWPPMRAGDPRIMQLGDAPHPRPILPARKLRAVREFLAKGGKPGLF